MYGSSAPPPPPSGSGGSAGSRYTYLVGRLRNRQITMEEATELFTVMQTMVQRANETARAALRTPAASSVPIAPVPEAPRTAAPTGSSDDLLVVGLLAMGAGAGLIAALAKRMGEPPPIATVPATRTKANGSSR
ncbi:MAG TPA: hypothetical protein VMG14_08615 [Thermoplasmata archaeon]|nr:hypothetical protein [Thermoplasmata archaeon]